MPSGTTAPAPAPSRTDLGAVSRPCAVGKPQPYVARFI
jgi:hypothetical protein